MSATAIPTDTAASIPVGVWDIDPAHSRVGFAVRHLGIATVHGTFDRFAGSLSSNGDLSAARIATTIETASANTGVEQRDAHLRSADFFDVDRFPEARFESTVIRDIGEQEIVIEGNVTIHGVTLPIELRGEISGFETDPWGNERVGISLSGALSRGAFGMTFNQALGGGNVLVSDKVKLTIDVSAVRRAA